MRTVANPVVTQVSHPVVHQVVQNVNETRQLVGTAPPISVSQVQRVDNTSFANH